MLSLGARRAARFRQMFPTRQFVQFKGLPIPRLLVRVVLPTLLAVCLGIGICRAESKRSVHALGLGTPSSSVGASDATSLLPRDSLTGTPFVTCRQWVVADAGTGAIVNESGGSAVVDVASTTKIMTAHLVLRLAQADDALLGQAVRFSTRAAQTEGSSCGVNVGETISVRELLFGLLVRSGNDAAVALAEHVGKRFEPASARSSDDALARFVAEMNREARRLGMKATKYINPHGLPAKGHLSSARDLVRLTIEARKASLFREIVSTREFSAEVTGKDGSRRKQTWKTTNRLLSIEGYSGVKTGYTRAAGSCLVSTGQRGRDELLVVVLGAPSASAAVADSRNLYRWAWQARGHRE